MIHHIAISPCPNDIFIFSKLILKSRESSQPKYRFSFHDIESLNRLFVSDCAPDLMKISCARLASSKGWTVADCGAALGRGVGPLIVGKGNLPLSERRELFIPGKGTTAGLLCDRYAPPLPRRECLYSHILPRLQENPDCAGVLIHESRFLYRQAGMKLLLDLGKEWEKDTGLPLPLGCLCLSNRLSPDIRAKMQQDVVDSILFAQQNTRQILPLLREYANEMNDEAILRHIDLYVNDFSISLKNEGRNAIKNLLASKCGKVPLVEFFGF